MNLDYNPFERKYALDPFPTYQAMREDGPVHFWSKANFWTICTHKEVSKALQTPSVFSNRAMAEILLGQLPGESGDSGEKDTPPTREQVGGWMATADPPVHTELRKIVNRGFGPNIIRSMESIAEETVNALIAGMKAKPGFDIINDLGAHLPVIMICKLLGIDETYHKDVRSWTNTMVQGMTGSKRHLGPIDSGAYDARMNLDGVIGKTIAEKVKNPDDSVVCRFLTATEDGALSQEEALGFGAQLLFAGSETTTHLIGNSIYSLLKNPENIDAICDDPSLIPGLMEETVRWNGPVQYVFRRVVEDVEVAGQIIPKGANVCLLLGSANRDPEKWGEDSEEFKLTRDTAGSLGFGLGPHFCLGAPLARMESRIALKQLVPMIKESKFATGEIDIIDSAQFRGYQSLSFAPN